MTGNKQKPQVLKCFFTHLKKWKYSANRPFWRLYWNSPGSLISTADQQLRSNQSMILGIPPDLSVTQEIEQPFDHLWMHVKFPLTLKKNEIFLVQVDEGSQARLRRLRELKLAGNHGWEMDLLQDFMANWFFSGLDSQLTAEHRRQTPFERARTLMAERLVSGLSLSELSEQLGMSEKVLARIFKENSGLTPHRYLVRLRCQKAADLLAQTDKTIEEISDACGFCDRHYMTRMFKREYCQPPAEFRKKLD